MQDFIVLGKKRLRISPKNKKRRKKKTKKVRKGAECSEPESSTTETSEEEIKLNEQEIPKRKHPQLSDSTEENELKNITQQRKKETKMHQKEEKKKEEKSNEETSSSPLGETYRDVI